MTFKSILLEASLWTVSDGPLKFKIKISPINVDSLDHPANE